MNFVIQMRWNLYAYTLYIVQPMRFSVLTRKSMKKYLNEIMRTINYILRH